MCLGWCAALWRRPCPQATTPTLPPWHTCADILQDRMGYNITYELWHMCSRSNGVLPCGTGLAVKQGPPPSHHGTEVVYRWCTAGQGGVGRDACIQGPMVYCPVAQALQSNNDTCIQVRWCALCCPVALALWAKQPPPPSHHEKAVLLPIILDRMG